MVFWCVFLVLFVYWLCCELGCFFDQGFVLILMLFAVVPELVQVFVVVEDVGYDGGGLGSRVVLCWDVVVCKRFFDCVF